ncbi:hypothetical protein RJ640_020795 [Escallonia rubra]|uniref:Complex 1 LYR protein domain-containing protein n=1 Tax=Escallonia rubra TaxID=112253 RepID=A0AA88U8I1_9ASTE|nr:hypothetical protein RJ640_020795 [Escallonia rubra]
MFEEESPKLISLEDILPKTKSERREYVKRRYVKIKEPLYNNGARVYWELEQPKKEHEDAEFFEFIEEESPKLISLEDILPKTKSERREYVKRRYVKIKEPLYNNGARVYWELEQPKKEHEDAEFFEFIDRHIVQFLVPWTDRGKMMANVQKCRRLAVPANHLRSNPFIHHRRNLHNGPDTIEELIDRHVTKTDKKTHNDDENELLTRQRLTSTRREALSLYRDIIRATRFFMWPDAKGVLWRDVLRENARKEFEEARFEKDPEIITRLLIGGHDAVQAALDKAVEKQRQQIEKEKAGQDRR